jgi:hypothetical protein
MLHTIAQRPKAAANPVGLIAPDGQIVGSVLLIQIRSIEPWLGPLPPSKGILNRAIGRLLNATTHDG